MFKENISLEEFKQNCEEWKKILTSEEKRGIYLYSCDDYLMINDALMAKAYENKELDEEIKNKVQILDSALNKNHFEKKIKVRRVYTIKKEQVDNFLELITKRKLFLPKFISASIDSNYRKNECNWESQIYIVIEAIVPEKVNCGFLDEELSEYPDEYELLIRRNCIFLLGNIDNKVESEKTIYLKGVFRYYENGGNE